MRLSKRVLNILPSATSSLDAQIKERKSKGEDIIHLGGGDPGYDTHGIIREAAKKAIDNGFTHYTATSGIMELKEAIVQRMKEEHGVQYNTNNVIVSTGAKQCLYNIFQTIINPGDEVIIPAPYWVSYPEMVKLAGGVPVYVDMEFENGFSLNASKIKQKITTKTKAILINSPSNPTGAIISQDELKNIVNIAKEKDLYIIADEIYNGLVYDAEYCSISSVANGAQDRIIIINGMSKAFAMTGWRIGYMILPEEIAKYVSMLQSHITSNANSIAQYASVEALVNYNKIVSETRQEFQNRRDYMYEKLKEVKGLILPPKPNAAFYIFAKMDCFNGDSLKLSEYLLDEAQIGVIPGITFGMDGFVRFSFTSSIKDMERGIERLKDTMDKI